MNLQRKIKIEFIKHQTSGAEIAREMGVHRTAIYHVLSGRSRSERLREAIAQKIGTDPERLWPNES